MLDLAAHEPFIVGFVGNLPIGTPEFAERLKRFVANKLFRGSRIRDRKLEGVPLIRSPKRVEMDCSSMLVVGSLPTYRARTRSLLSCPGPERVVSAAVR